MDVDNIIELTNKGKMVWDKYLIPDFYWNREHSVFHSKFENESYICHFAPEGKRWFGILRECKITKLSKKSGNSEIVISNSEEKLIPLWKAVKHSKISTSGMVCYLNACL